MELQIIKRCSYRNCNKVLIDMKTNAKYCSRIHKEYERIYRLREDKSFKSEKNRDNQLIQEAENLESLKDPNVLMLFNLINGK